MGLVFVNILQLFLLQLFYTQQAGACLTSGVTIPTTWWYFSLPPLLWLVISWCATYMRSWSPTASSQKALTHSLSFSRTVLSGPCIRACYNQNIELHPGPCPAFVHFSEGTESVFTGKAESFVFLLLHLKVTSSSLLGIPLPKGFPVLTVVRNMLSNTSLKKWSMAPWHSLAGAVSISRFLSDTLSPAGTHHSLSLNLQRCQWKSQRENNIHVSSHTQLLVAMSLHHHKEWGAHTTANWSTLHHKGGRARKLVLGRRW